MRNISIVNNGIKPASGQLEPTIQITTLVNQIWPGNVFFDFRGELYSGNTKLCNLISPLSSALNNKTTVAPYNYERKRDRSFNMVLHGQLSKKALDFIETQRQSDPKNDVQLNIAIEAKYYESCHDGFSEHKGTPDGETRIHHYLTSKNDEYLLFEVCKDHSKYRQTIPASRWIHDFMPAFGLGKFIVYEIPLLTFDGINSKFQERFEEAIEAIKVMEEAKKRGSWNDVVKESRPVMELVRHPELIEDTLKGANFPQPAIDDFKAMLKGAFDYSSKFIHRVSRNKSVMPIAQLEKEDAMFTYTLCVNIVTVLAQKIYRRG